MHKNQVMHVSRKLNWISSLMEDDQIVILEKKLADFYSGDAHYFSEIDFTTDNWVNPSECGYAEIVRLAKQADSIAEIGCGSSNILKYYPELIAKYSGFDFSAELMKRNKSIYPGAEFTSFAQPNIFPAQDEAYDLVFSVFVIEHVVRPAVFLQECSRILKKGGTLVILCPDFLDQGRMTSQRSGYSPGTSRTKLKQNKMIDAVVTLFDNRIRIPYLCKKYKMRINESSKFFINLNPVVFTDSFEPDVDAVYVTYKPEIISYLKPAFSEIRNDEVLKEYEANKKVIFLKLKKSSGA